VSGPQPFRRPAIDFEIEKIDAILVTSPANVRYAAGFTGSNGLLLVTRDSATFFTDPRYAIQSAQEVSIRTEIVPRGGLLTAVAKHIVRKRLRRVGFEKQHLSYAQYVYLEGQLPARTRLEGIEDVIQRQRMVKTPEEIAAIRRSVVTNSQAFDRAVKKVKPRMRESDLAAELDYQMRRFGAEGPAFETIVASGDRTALPHARPTARPIGANEILLIDMGASRDGYASDMTRVLHLGRESRETARMYRAVLEAQLAAIDVVRPGITAGRVDLVARQVLRKHGLARAFTHSTGHGLGLEIHEPPRLGRGDKTRLEAGMTITIEPGAYIEGFGGIRIEDTVVVTSHGSEVLTPTPKELITL
jgi:Xaa-Pro aminopeptidase